METSDSQAKSSKGDWDVVIFGGALSGSATAFLLLRQRPHLRVLIVEKSDHFSRRVGESTVEISSYFLGHVLGLTQYLNENHLNKQGLRFWFSNERTQTLASCSETGAAYNVRFPGYQVDRATLDEEVLQRAAAAGATLMRPARVVDFELIPGGLQTVTVEKEGSRQTYTSRWVVDASGFSAVVARKKRWIEPNTRHPIAAVWSRFRDVKDWDGLELAERHPEWAGRVVATRGTATNHLLGKGYWIWCIPLKGGDVSLGLVYDQRLVDFPTHGVSARRLQEFIQTHPAGKELVEGATPVEDDVHVRKNFAYHSTRLADDGVVLVGDAGAFLDPFYSPGMDWVSFSTTTAVDLLDASFGGEEIGTKIESINERFPHSYKSWFEAIYLDKYFYMGDWELMTLAFRLDLGLYYFGMVSQPFRDGPQALLDPPFAMPIARPAFKLIRLYNRRFAAIARDRMRRGTWGRRNDGRVYPFNSYRLGPILPCRILWALAAWGWLEVREGWRTWFRSDREIEMVPATAEDGSH